MRGEEDLFKMHDWIMLKLIKIYVGLLIYVYKYSLESYATLHSVLLISTVYRTLSWAM